MESASELEAIGAVFDHTAVAAPRIRDLLPIYRDLLGGTYLGGGDNTRSGYRTLQLEYPGGNKVELMEPLAGSTFFDSFFELTRGRGGVHHLNFHVPDIDAAVAALRARGYRLHGLNLGDPRWREVFLHPKEAHGVLIQLAQRGYPHPDPAPSLEDLLAGHGRRGNGVPSP
ncbi:methylmalonyl-CoA/ethylmalonyl-CoA epimerase [Thermocatellispora tengchongensis]|uniref:Methylmalonyl-CoA/ethylmalonyl-CoA epimerase n=1 Tax=Thermocatellispora tengchongensis TaxID=1073253 RepID=A0A840PQR7_9ACTN|nr:VOC family protein [Thermocatellispora tengchongensis]MBB5140120.1 methylmalonyl-CoA/ethylmalonyl-CoA epimerase [Thermocatellispora tengchongensis]